MNGAINGAANSDASAWALDPAIDYLNHGSFGARLHRVIAAQSAWRARMEREPITYFTRDLEMLLDEARSEVAAFVRADPKGLVFVPNVTTGVAAVLGSISLREGDAILTTNHVYNACRNALTRTAARNGAQLVVAEIPLPIRHEDEVVDAILRAVTPRTRLAFVDHVTSPTGIVFPITKIVRELRARGVEVLVDGAHGPGMVDLDINAIGAGSYAGNLHKWTCAPVGAGFLSVREDLRDAVLPALTSHGANSTRRDRPQLWNEFDWAGTLDYSPYFTAPIAIREIGALHEEGWDGIRKACRDRALEGRNILAASLGVEAPVPDSMIGTMAALALPDGVGAPPTSALYLDPLQQTLFERHRIEVPIVPWPAWPKRLVRISAYLYNHRDQYERLAGALREELGGAR